MHDIHVDNVTTYLRSHGIDADMPELLAGGVSNQVLRVRVGSAWWVVKQSRPQLRTKDAWFSDLGRIHREQEVMQALEPSLPQGVVPRVLFVDRPNFVYAMSHAPLDARVWKGDLLAGDVRVERGEAVGKVLGLIHQISADRRDLFDAFADHHVYVQLRVDPFYRRVQERRPEVSAAIEPIIDEMLSLKQALCHGDYTPKNMLAHDTGFTLVDYETAHLGDPTMDLGLLFAHLRLKASRAPEVAGRFHELTRTIWKAYQPEVRFAPLADLERRAVRHFAVCLLARIDGTSPVDYLPWEDRRELLRALARSILLEGRTRWEEVWD